MTLHVLLSRCRRLLLFLLLPPLPLLDTAREPQAALIDDIAQHELARARVDENCPLARFRAHDVISPFVCFFF